MEERTLFYLALGFQEYSYQVSQHFLNFFTAGYVHLKVNQKNCQNEIVFDRLWYPLSILLLTAIGAKLIGPHGGLQVDKSKVGKVTGSVDAPRFCYFIH